nr:immunoglobulin light chain junction region [Macaca mulatta]MOW52083.1 immunoglobulin light chain junction region [Macaca mulatta]MOW52919.1 immunoglobulin light chain junction region [Macaca mulatta]
CQSQNSHPWTL